LIEEVLQKLLVLVTHALFLTLVNGDDAHILFRKLDTLRFWLFQAYLELDFHWVIFFILILFLIGFSFLFSDWHFLLDSFVVYKLDCHCLFGFTVLELQFVKHRKIVFKLSGVHTVLSLCQWLSFDHTGNLTITALASGNNNVNLIPSLVSFDLTGLESNVSWEVLIKDGYFAFGVITGQSLVIGNVINFYEKVEVWVPFIIINNLDLDFFLQYHVVGSRFLLHNG